MRQKHDIDDINVSTDLKLEERSKNCNNSLVSEKYKVRYVNYY